MGRFVRAGVAPVVSGRSEGIVSRFARVGVAPGTVGRFVRAGVAPGTVGRLC